MINQMIEGIFEGARNDLFFKVDGNEFTLCVGIRFISGHGCSSGMDSIQMSISIMDCPCCSSVLSVQTDLFYRLNAKISRSVAICCIAFVKSFYLFLKLLQQNQASRMSMINKCGYRAST